MRDERLEKRKELRVKEQREHELLLKVHEKDAQECEEKEHEIERQLKEKRHEIERERKEKTRELEKLKGNVRIKRVNLNFNAKGKCETPKLN